MMDCLRGGYSGWEEGLWWVWNDSDILFSIAASLFIHNLFHTFFFHWSRFVCVWGFEKRREAHQQQSPFYLFIFCLCWVESEYLHTYQCAHAEETSWLMATEGGSGLAARVSWRQAMLLCGMGRWSNADLEEEEVGGEANLLQLHCFAALNPCRPGSKRGRRWRGAVCGSQILNICMCRASEEENGY